MEKTLNEINLTALKAAAWDVSVLIEELRRRLQIMQTEIANRQKQDTDNGNDTAK